MNLQFLKNPDPRYLPSLSDMEAKVEELLWLDKSGKDKILDQFKAAFADTPDHSDILEWRALWMVYIKFTWSFFRAQDRDFFERTIIGKQIPMAAALGYDLLDEIFRYLNARTTDPDDMASVYGNIRRTFFDSPAIIGKIDGQNFLIRDLVKKEKYLNSVKNNTLEEAQFRDNLQRALFPKEENFLTKYFVYDDKDLAITNLLNLTDFFLGVEPDKVWYAVDGYINPDKYQTFAEVVDKNSGIARVETMPDLELPENANITPLVSTEETDKMTYREIAAKIENEQPRDAEGNFENLDAVFDELEKLSEKYNDPKIKDLYYFDENSGNFKWNE